MNEQISALMDDEDINSHLLDNLTKSHEMQKTWLRYHLIRSCLCRNQPKFISVNLSHRVARSLESESNVFISQKSNRFSLKPIAGFAIAASVAMAVILGIQFNINDDYTPLPSIMSNVPIADTTALPFAESRILPAAAKELSISDPLANQQINRYLLNHNEYRSNVNVNGILPYARIITIDSQE